MSDKWYLRDWRSPQRTVVGTLMNVHNSGGVVSTNPGDNDTNVLVQPVPPAPGEPDILLNRFGGPNTATADHTQMECEVNVPSDGRDAYENWVRTMLGQQVTLQGVYVDDTEHDNKSELHPLDLVVGQVDASQIPGNWLDQIMVQHHVELGTSLNLFRFAAASDDRAGVFFEGPPLAEFDRDTSLALPMPPRPNADPGLVAQADWQPTTTSNASVSFVPASPGQGDVVNLVVQCTGVGFGDPGWVLGEVATYWLVAARQLDVSPQSVQFGTVDIGESKTENVTITNTGTGPVVLTVPPPPPPVPPMHVFPYEWQPVATTTLASGGSLTVAVRFTALKAGVAQTALTVTSDAQGSPQRVTLTGTGSSLKPK